GRVGDGRGNLRTVRGVAQDLLRRHGEAASEGVQIRGGLDRRAVRPQASEVIGSVWMAAKGQSFPQEQRRKACHKANAQSAARQTSSPTSPCLILAALGRATGRCTRWLTNDRMPGSSRAKSNPGSRQWSAATADTRSSMRKNPGPFSPLIVSNRKRAEARALSAP